MKQKCCFRTQKPAHIEVIGWAYDVDCSKPITFGCCAETPCCHADACKWTSIVSRSRDELWCGLYTALAVLQVSIVMLLHDIQADTDNKSATLKFMVDRSWAWRQQCATSWWQVQARRSVKKDSLSLTNSILHVQSIWMPLFGDMWLNDFCCCTVLQSCWFRSSVGLDPSWLGLWSVFV